MEENEDFQNTKRQKKIFESFTQRLPIYPRNNIVLHYFVQTMYRWEEREFYIKFKITI